MVVRLKFFLLLIAAVAIGLTICWIDSRSTWDDAGITAFMLFGAALLMGLLAERNPWLMAIAIGVWIPLWQINQDANYGSLFALGVAFAGAYFGFGIRKIAGIGMHTKQ